MVDAVVDCCHTHNDTVGLLGRPTWMWASTPSPSSSLQHAKTALLSRAVQNTLSLSCCRS